jgi:hypothetical protein
VERRRHQRGGRLERHVGVVLAVASPRHRSVVIATAACARMWARARDKQLALPRRTSGRSALAWRLAGRVPSSRREPRPAKLTPRGGRRSGWLLPANSTMAPTTPTQTPCRGTGRGGSRRIQRRHRARHRRWSPPPPRGACNCYLSGAAGPRTSMFPSSPARAKDQSCLSQRPEGQPRADGGACGRR